MGVPSLLPCCHKVGFLQPEPCIYNLLAVWDCMATANCRSVCPVYS